MQQIRGLPIKFKTSKMALFGTPLMMAVCQGPPSSVEMVFTSMARAHDYVDTLDDLGQPGSGVTPLMACSFHSDDEAVAIAQILIANGASLVMYRRDLRRNPSFHHHRRTNRPSTLPYFDGSDF